MKVFDIKLTNCTTETGGGKIPKRLRHNQNINLSLSENILNQIPKKLYSFIRNGKLYKTTYTSKCIIKKEVI